MGYLKVALLQRHSLYIKSYQIMDDCTSALWLEIFLHEFNHKCSEWWHMFTGPTYWGLLLMWLVTCVITCLCSTVLTVCYIHLFVITWRNYKTLSSTAHLCMCNITERLLVYMEKGTCSGAFWKQEPLFCDLYNVNHLMTSSCLKSHDHTYCGQHTMSWNAKATVTNASETKLKY